jgi:hypothetical protein
MRVIEDASAASLHSFVKDCIDPDSTIHTDGWQGYAGLETKGYQREITRLRGRRKEASHLMPRVHRVAALLKRWISGTDQGAVSPRGICRTTWMNSRSLQSPEVEKPRQALLPANAAAVNCCDTRARGFECHSRRAQSHHITLGLERKGEI